MEQLHDRSKAGRAVSEAREQQHPEEERYLHRRDEKGSERKPQSSDVRAQRIVGNNRLLDQIRTLSFLPPRFIAPERPVPHLFLPTPDRRRYQRANFNGCHLAAQWRSNVVWLGAAYAQACGAGCSSQDRNLRAMRGVYQNCTDWKCENETILLQPRPPRRS